MTAEEYTKKYLGRAVKLNAKRQSTSYKDWEGIIVEQHPEPFYKDYISTQTTKQPVSDMLALGSNVLWFPEQLELIENLEDEFPVITIKDNHHPCPNCKSLECKGLARLDCISKAVSRGR